MRCRHVRQRGFDSIGSPQLAICAGIAKCTAIPHAYHIHIANRQIINRRCNGEVPCAYCVSRNHAERCVYTTLPPRPAPVQSTIEVASTAPTIPARVPSTNGTRGEEVAGDTAVPLEARLLRDDRGTEIFIGDCAPLSFLSTVRHLIVGQIDSDGFPNDLTKATIVEKPQKDIDGPQPAPTIEQVSRSSVRTSRVLLCLSQLAVVQLVV